jgi:hypothetical protein
MNPTIKVTTPMLMITPMAMTKTNNRRSLSAADLLPQGTLDESFDGVLGGCWVFMIPFFYFNSDLYSSSATENATPSSTH